MKPYLANTESVTSRSFHFLLTSQPQHVTYAEAHVVVEYSAVSGEQFWSNAGNTSILEYRDNVVH